MKIDDVNVVSKGVQGKTIESATFAVYSVEIKFTDGTYLDIDLNKAEGILEYSFSNWQMTQMKK